MDDAVMAFKDSELENRNFPSKWTQVRAVGTSVLMSPVLTIRRDLSSNRSESHTLGLFF